MSAAPSTTSSSYSYTTVAPLTTIWTPPAACATPTPTLFGGTCSDPYCWSYSPQDVISYWDADINVAYWTTNNQQIMPSCAPPSSQAILGFSYSPAAGCPFGYQTASSWSTDDTETTAICCPP